MKYLKDRKNKIEFFNNDPSVIDNYPIMESKELKLNWVKRVREDYQNQVNQGKQKLAGWSHLSRCPGIFDLFKYGYVIPLHKDVIIRPNGKEFDWMSPSKNVQVQGMSREAVDMISKPPWAADFILKIVTGWHVIAPKGLKFITLPIAYPDTFNFTSTTGIYDPSDSTELNFQMFWNGTDEETVIKAGTPLGHLIPLSDRKFKMVQRTMNQRDKEWKMKLDSTFDTSFWRSTMRNKVANMYNKYWKR
jgi:hypothetical protein